MPARLMLDPSLFTSYRTLKVIRDALEARHLPEVMLPESFLSAISADNFSASTLKFFGARPETLPDLRNLRSLLPRVLPLPPLKRNAPVEDEFGRRLADIVPNYQVFQILLEEWDFLNSESWIAARAKRSFATFIRAGAVAVEVGKKSVNHLILRTLKTSPENIPVALSSEQKLRAAAKWLAVGGMSVTPFLQPLSGTLINTAAGFFLLFDP